MICDYSWEWHLNWYSFPRRNRSNFFYPPSIVSDIVQVAVAMLLHSIIYAHWNVMKEYMSWNYTYMYDLKKYFVICVTLFTDDANNKMQHWKLLKRKIKNK